MLVWLVAPEYYFGVPRESDTALLSYIVAALLLLVAVLGFGMELARSEVNTFLLRLLRRRLPRGV